ncbi:hypothetical protein B4086_5626 [Bacillus cereus]|nr:hypothetical protein B4086_5626 [Bacillus cereus]
MKQVRDLQEVLGILRYLVGNGNRILFMDGDVHRRNRILNQVTEYIGQKRKVVAIGLEQAMPKVEGIEKVLCEGAEGRELREQALAGLERREDDAFVLCQTFFLDGGFAQFIRYLARGKQGILGCNAYASVDLGLSSLVAQYQRSGRRDGIQYEAEEAKDTVGKAFDYVVYVRANGKVGVYGLTGDGLEVKELDLRRGVYIDCE